MSPVHRSGSTAGLFKGQSHSLPDVGDGVIQRQIGLFWAVMRVFHVLAALVLSSILYTAILIPPVTARILLGADGLVLAGAVLLLGRYAGDPA